jgi:hypothetical protein
MWTSAPITRGSQLILHAASNLRHFYALLATTRHGTSCNMALDCDEHT